MAFTDMVVMAMAVSLSTMGRRFARTPPLIDQIERVESRAVFVRLLLAPSPPFGYIAARFRPPQRRVVAVNMNRDAMAGVAEASQVTFQDRISRFAWVGAQVLQCLSRYACFVPFFEAWGYCRTSWRLFALGQPRLNRKD
jgi:hypothetical protein